MTMTLKTRLAEPGRLMSVHVCLTSHCHFFRMAIETCLHSLEHGLVLPSGDPSFVAAGAATLDRATLTGVGSVAT